MILKRNHLPSRLIFSACLAFCFLLPSRSLVAQPDAGKSYPNRLDFGTVRVNATVEGSVRIFKDSVRTAVKTGKDATAINNVQIYKDGDKPAGVSFGVQPPSFATITTVELGVQTYAKDDTRIFCDVSVAITTQRIGEYAGAMKVQVGSEETTVPIRVNVLPQDPSATSVLIAQTPFDKFSTNDATAFDPWLRLVESANLDPHYLDVARNRAVLREIDLSKFDVILLGGMGLVSLLDSDVTKLKQYVNDGGRLVINANHFFRGTVDHANELLGIVGLRMTDTEEGGTNSFELSGNAIVSDPLTKAVSSVKFFGSSD